jgi:dolichol-phosphate mannosyltransferase
MEKIVVIIPTYNEVNNIEKIIREIFKNISNIHVRIVDDNSPDGTGLVVEKMTKDFPNLSLFKRDKKEGLGNAYIDAFSRIIKDGSFSHICMMDGDFSHNPFYLTQMIEQSQNHNVVIGSRYIKGGGTEGWELWRRILSRWANFYCRLITGIPVYDCTGGFNLIDIEYLKKIDFSKFEASGYAFIMELKFNLYKLGVSFKEVPIIFKNRQEGESKISNHIISEGIIAPWKMRFKKRI